MTKEEILDSNANPSGKLAGFYTRARVLEAMEQYANLKAIEVAGEAWEDGFNRREHLGKDYKSGFAHTLNEATTPSLETYLSNLKKKLQP